MVVPIGDQSSLLLPFFIAVALLAIGQSAVAAGVTLFSLEAVSKLFDDSILDIFPKVLSEAKC